MFFADQGAAEGFRSFALMPSGELGARISYRLFGRRKHGFSLDVGFNPKGLLTWMLYDEAEDVGYIYSADPFFEHQEDPSMYALWASPNKRHFFLYQLKYFADNKNLVSQVLQVEESKCKYGSLKKKVLEDALHAFDLDASSLNDLLFEKMRGFYAPLSETADMAEDDTYPEAAVRYAFPDQELVFRIDAGHKTIHRTGFLMGHLGWHPATGVPWLIVTFPYYSKRNATPITWLKNTRPLMEDHYPPADRQSFLSFQLPARKGFESLLPAAAASPLVGNESQLFSTYYYRADNQNPGIVIQNLGMTPRTEGHVPIRRTIGLVFVTFPLWLTEEKEGVLEPTPDAITQEHVYKILQTLPAY